MSNRLNPTFKPVLAAVIAAGAILYAAAELFAPAVSASQQPAPASCCRYTSECNTGYTCVTRENAPNCSPYNQPNYCEKVKTTIFVPTGGDS